MPIRGVDNTSPEAAYATKPNIVHPGVAAQVVAARTRAAAEYAAQGSTLGSPGAAKGVTVAAGRHEAAPLTTSGDTGITDSAKTTQGTG